MFFRLIESCFFYSCELCAWKVSSLLFIMDVKVKSENVSVKSENVSVKLENVSVKLENESVSGNLNVKLLIHVSVVQAVERAPLLLALVDPSTGFCHGIEDIVKEEEEFVKRRRVTVVAGSKRTKFFCDSCNYSSKQK